MHKLKDCQSNELIRVFVYGTLKPGEANYQRYCAGKVLETKRAITFGQLYALPFGYPAMTLGNSLVNGFLLAFPNSTILSQLDWLEGYDSQRLETANEYNRRLIETYDIHQAPLGLAWVYLMLPEQVHSCSGVLLPQGWWSGLGKSCVLEP